MTMIVGALQPKKEKPKEVDDRTPWFERPEHAAERYCTCFCGQSFRSEARNIQFVDKVQQGTAEVQQGTAEVQQTVNGCLSKKACPRCGQNRIKEFH